MIIPISRHNLDLIYEYEPALNRALDRTSLAKSWNMDALIDNLVNYKVFAFVQKESGYIAVFTVAQSPLQRSMYLFWGGKQPDNDTPIDYQELTSAMEDIAKHFQCTHILVEGRKGWEKVSKPFGYVEDSRTYVKEVSYELPTIQPTASDGGEPGDCGPGEQPLQGGQEFDVHNQLDSNLDSSSEQTV